MDQHRKDLPHDALFVDQVGRGAVVPRGVLSIDIRHDVEVQSRVKFPCHLAMRLEIFVLLGDGNHHRVSLLKFVVDFVQLNQLLGTKRSPMGSVGGDDNVFLAKVLSQRHVGSIGFG